MTLDEHWEFDGEPEDVGIVREVEGRAGVRMVGAYLNLSRTLARGEAAEGAGADVAVADVLRAARVGAPVYDGADATDDPEARVGALRAETVEVELDGLAGGAYDCRARVRLSAVVRAERADILHGRKLIGRAVEVLT